MQKIYLYLNCIFLSLVIIVFYFSFVPKTFYTFFNSDLLYLPSLYKDIFVDNFSISGWKLTPAPYFFPDMFIYFILMFFTNCNVYYSTYIIGIIQIFLFLFSGSLAISNIINRKFIEIFELLSIIVMIILISIIFFRFPFDITLSMYLPSFHFGAFICSLICLTMLFKLINKNNFFYLLSFFIFLIISLTSDRLMFTTFIIPTLISLFIVRKKISTESKIAINTIIIIATLCSLVFISILTKYHFLSVVPYEYKNFIIKEKIMVLLSIFKNNINYCIIILLAITNIIFYYLNKKNSVENFNLNFYLNFNVFMNLTVLIIPILTMDNDSMTALRYCFPVFFIFLLNFIIFLYLKNLTDSLLFPKIKSVIFIIIFISIVFIFGKTDFKIDNLIFYPEITKFLDNNAEKYNLKYGISNYWNAKLNTFFSKKNIRVYQVQSHGEKANICYYHINNVNWYIGEKNSFYNKPYYNFLISEGLNFNAVINQFGHPSHVVQFKNNICLLIYNKDESFDKNLKYMFFMVREKN
ncbi:MAG: hypothetical protein QMC67_11690 [Candidatus Wallbacteria bacterium]